MKAEALKITRKIVELENQIAKLKSEISKLENEFESLVEPKTQFNHTLNYSGIYSNSEDWWSQNITQRVKHFFINNPDRAFSIDALQSLIPEASSDTLRATVSRLANKEKVIRNVNRGIYQYQNEENEINF